MSLKHIFGLIVISGIFSKRSKKLDILPPPPPFPDIEKQVEKERKQKDKKAKSRVKKKKQRPEWKEKREKEFKKMKKQTEKLKQQKLKRKSELKKKNKALMRKRADIVKEKTFQFFNRVGLVRTEKEKKELERQKQEYINLRKLAKKGKEERKKEAEELKQMELELKKEKKQKLQLKEKKEPVLEDFKLSEELEDIEDITPKPKIEEEEKLDVPEFKFPKLEVERDIVKPREVENAEDEIEKAIQGMKIKTRPSIVKGLFKKREKPVEEKIETPEVMPRTYDKIEHVELIEEKLHKARTALMDFKFDDAKKIYIEILMMYNTLESKKKAKVYQDIRDFYYERKSAEKFAK